ncbi:MAG: glutathione binding-like protein [Methylocella sp.]
MMRGHPFDATCADPIFLRRRIDSPLAKGRRSKVHKVLSVRLVKEYDCRNREARGLKRISDASRLRTAAALPSLLAFPTMTDTDMCRLILTHYEIPYREDPHIFGWASVLALFSAGSVQIPVLVGPDYRLVGPRQIAGRFDKDCPAAGKLVPDDATLRAEFELDWTTFDGVLARTTAILAYYHLLPHREIMIEPLTRGVPTLEASFVRSAYPLFSEQFRLLLQLNKENAQKALDQTRAVFNQTDARLADGRRFLVGESLTLSDLRFVSAAAPVLLPKGYSSPIPPFERMPSEFQAIITEMRQHPAARYVERIYDSYRNK